MSDIEFENYLKDGEHILWSQIPEKRKLHLHSGIIPIVLGAVFLIAGLYVLLNEHDYYSLIFIIVGLLCIFTFIERSAVYLLTDKRILIIKNMTVKEISYYHISFVTVHKNKNSDIGTVKICFTHLSDSPNSRGEYRVSWISLYDIPDCERVADIIKTQKDLPDAYDKAREAERMQGF
ncbi:hypothetical protein [Ruminococcus flavefaciens]|uniref:hypothetical protein n=1 Tax=Ruminococcus flavefaciens TaxID=1265 RepID=UPI00048F13D5|nr:hypothetical protein [Ruminococcus flavefaciens]